eukprot:SAG31_NODE_5130_length_2724_cov_1.619048_3_plen_161_part_00
MPTGSGNTSSCRDGGDARLENLRAQLQSPGSTAILPAPAEAPAARSRRPAAEEKSPPQMRAARLVAAKKMDVLQCMRPSLLCCPPGSVLVRVRYASICGSDFPLWKADTMPKPVAGTPSAAVEADGFCGHEVVGEVRIPILFLFESDSFSLRITIFFSLR